jgi:hypothetical protein
MPVHGLRPFDDAHLRRFPRDVSQWREKGHQLDPRIDLRLADAIRGIFNKAFDPVVLSPASI